MQPVLNVEDVRHLEEALVEVGVSLSELMRRAGEAAAEEALAMGSPERVVVLAGVGNNGGDGWVAAETLVGQGYDACVVTAVEPEDLATDLARAAAACAVEAGVAYEVAPSRDILEELLADADVVVDAIFGTGFHGVPRAPFDMWIDCVNSSGVSVVAVDVPSGLSAQTGHADAPCVIADTTVTMLALKPGLVSDAGRDVCGPIVVAPLAEQTEQLAVEADPVAWRTDPSDYLAVMTAPSSAVDKFTRGSVLVVGGSARYPGAPMMAAMAAARAGAGYVTLAVPACIASVVQARMLEVPVVALPCNEEDGTLSLAAIDLVERLAATRSAVLVGPGMGVSTGTMGIVSRLLEAEVPLVIDADGLNCLARLTSGHLEDFPELLRREAPLVLTPHRGELGRLVGLDDTPPDSLAAMLDAARRIVWSEGGSELVVVAKASATACVGVEAAVLPKPGPSALATAGSGDVLGGIMASLLAQASVREGVSGEDLPLLAALACEVHGRAGEVAVERYGTRGVIARDVIDAVGIAQDMMVADATMQDPQM